MEVEVLSFRSTVLLAVLFYSGLICLTIACFCIVPCIYHGVHRLISKIFNKISQNRGTKENPADAQNTDKEPRIETKKTEDKETEENPRLPTTGDAAVRRLLNCKGKDAYSTLGVNPNASSDDIRKAYKKQAVLVHPDKNEQPEAEEAFKILGSAYDLIGDENKRQEYNRKVREEKEAEARQKEADKPFRQYEEYSKWFQKEKKEKEADKPSRQYEEYSKWFQKEKKEARNRMLCASCGGVHKRTQLKRRKSAARLCGVCHRFHKARENDLWAETASGFGKYRYFACMEGQIYDVTDWAICNNYEFITQYANPHKVIFHLAKPSSPHSTDFHRQAGPCRNRVPEKTRDVSLFRRLIQWIILCFTKVFFPAKVNHQQQRNTFDDCGSFHGEPEMDWQQASNWQHTTDRKPKRSTYQTPNNRQQSKDGAQTASAYNVPGHGKRKRRNKRKH